MNTHTSHRATDRPATRSGRARLGTALTGGALLASSLLLAPAAALAAPAQTEDVTASSCSVTDGTLSWGVKESFRSYISGAIANGEWSASDGATYETPVFTWSGGAGEIDPATGTGSVSFVGIVHFTGHDGALDLTLANPTIEFGGDGEASLLLDSRSTDVSGELVLDVKQEWIGDVTVPETIAPVDDEMVIDEAPVKLTNAGVKAFAEFYEAGADLDPLSINLAVSGCESDAAGPVAEEPVEEEEVVAISEETSSIPWLPIIIGGVALLVIGVTTGMLIGGRKRGRVQPGSQSAEAGDRAGGSSTAGTAGADKLFSDE